MDDLGLPLLAGFPFEEQTYPVILELDNADSQAGNLSTLGCFCLGRRRLGGWWFSMFEWFWKVSRTEIFPDFLGEFPFIKMLFVI